MIRTQLLTLRRLWPLFGLWGLVRLVVQKMMGRNAIFAKVRGVPIPLLVRMNNSDLSVLYQVFGLGECRVELDQAPTVIVDGGANVGFASVDLALRYPNATILAVEPSAANFEILKANCAAFPNVKLFKAAIWHSNTNLEISNPTDRGWMIQVRESTVAATESVPSLTIRDLAAAGGHADIDVLKLDIEGAEQSIFADSDLGWIDDVNCLIIETHGNAAHQTVCRAMEEREFESDMIGEKLIFKRKSRSLQKSSRE